MVQEEEVHPEIWKGFSVHDPRNGKPGENSSGQGRASSLD
jgi:hypothetical protein